MPKGITKEDTIGELNDLDEHIKNLLSWYEEDKSENFIDSKFNKELHSFVRKVNKLLEEYVEELEESEDE